MYFKQVSNEEHTLKNFLKVLGLKSIYKIDI